MARDPQELLDLYDVLQERGWTRGECARFVMGVQMVVAHPEWGNALVSRMDMEYTTDEIEARHRQMKKLADAVPMVMQT